MNRFVMAALPWILVASVFAGCIGDDASDVPAEPEPCDPQDIPCLCDGLQSCIDDRTDTDGDGLTDAQEKALGTGVNDTDTDNDGVDDGAEVAAGTNPRIPHFPTDGSFEKMDIELDSVIGHKIPVTVFKPTAASAETPFPVLLHSHGFTGSRWSGDQATPYVEAGFAVVSFDERGHGDAKDDSEVTFMHPDAEVQDVITVIDHIASLDWVLKDLDDPTDPVLGTIGGSYGGAFQLMGSVFDDRIDAMVPEITWHNILEALAPNGAIKSGWVDLFYIAGNAQQSVIFSDDFHAGFAWATATNELPAGQAPGVPDLVTLFKEASPEFHSSGLDVPTLLVQGMPDTLFPLNQAVWNYDRIQENGAPVQLYTHLGGHVLSSSSLVGNTDPVPPLGLQGAAGGSPCGPITDLNILWHQKWLLDLPVDTGPEVCIALEDGTAISGDTFPLPGTDATSIPIDGVFPVVQGAGGGTTVPLYTLTAEEEMVVAGIPRLRGDLVSPGPDAIVYFSFQKLNTDGVFEHIVDDQVRPLRVPGPNTGFSFNMELGGIATRLAPGEQMLLVASSVEPMYFGNAERLPSGVVLQDLELQLPVVTDPQEFTS